MFSKSKTDFLLDTYDHLWRTAAATPPKGRIPGDVRAIITRGESTLSNTALRVKVPKSCLLIRLVPAKLDPTLMKEPRVYQGVPRINTVKAPRKPIPSMLGPNGGVNGLAQSPPS